METARWVSLVAATVTMGLVSGLFYGFSVAVMPGLRLVGDRTAVEVMQRVNTAILNGWFLLGYLGAFVFTALALLLHVPSTGRDVLPALIAALVCCGASMAVTAKVNIPLNNAWSTPAPPPPSATRPRYDAPSRAPGSAPTSGAPCCRRPASPSWHGPCIWKAASPDVVVIVPLRARRGSGSRTVRAGGPVGTDQRTGVAVTGFDSV
ncbi:DUF1772 domain-containing protein [Streptomyces sp. NBC_00442]|uniref:anthrone oxygenase family protein n=1 Tax=Streptomyces sp. NBC_00442 TaxID=2903651 RepID=UPI002E1A3B63